jgi:hypothetical protein
MSDSKDEQTQAHEAIKMLVDLIHLAEGDDKQYHHFIAKITPEGAKTLGWIADYLRDQFGSELQRQETESS